MAQTTKKNAMIFQSSSEPMLEGLIDIKADWPDLNGILGIIGTALPTITAIYCIWSFIKIRK